MWGTLGSPVFFFFLTTDTRSAVSTDINDTRTSNSNGKPHVLYDVKGELWYFFHEIAFVFHSRVALGNTSTDLTFLK